MTMTRSKIPALIGSAAAIVAFFFVGLFPAMAYGGYAGHLLAGGIVPGSSGIVARALVVFGMALGVVGVGSLFAVLGAMTGALVGAVTRLDVRKAAPETAAHK
jgi:CBS domain-containing protein